MLLRGGISGCWSLAFFSTELSRKIRIGFLDFEFLLFCLGFSDLGFKVLASGFFSLPEDSAAELSVGIKSASLPSSVDSSEKFITASMRASLSFNSAVISSARIESASVSGAAAASWESKGMASGVWVASLEGLGASGLAGLSDATVVGGIGLIDGEFALLEGQVRLL